MNRVAEYLGRTVRRMTDARRRQWTLNVLGNLTDEALKDIGLARDWRGRLGPFREQPH
jgi:uncharacterized protein YjiS (DUF1127 family)